MQDYITREVKFKDSKRYEIHEGKIYYMAGTSTNHGAIIINLSVIFGNYLKGKKCRLFGENISVIFEKGKREYLPDLKIVCDPGKIKNKKIHGTPDLIIEVLSPGTEALDMGYKKDIYEENGVKEYWTISPEAKSVAVYLLKGDRYRLDNVYSCIDSDDYENLSDEERENIKFEFKTSLYEDLVISVEDVFENVE